nr:hypothetical protein Iba_scaffold1393CG0150 [Ipomoea batatas]
MELSIQETYIFDPHPVLIAHIEAISLEFYDYKIFKSPEDYATNNLQEPSMISTRDISVNQDIHDSGPFMGNREKDDRLVHHPSGLPLAMVVPSSFGPDLPLTWAYNKRGKEKVFEGEKEIISKKLKESVSPDHAFHHRRLAIEGGPASFLTGQDQLFISPIRRYVRLVDQPS